MRFLDCRDKLCLNVENFSTVKTNVRTMQRLILLIETMLRQIKTTRLFLRTYFYKQKHQHQPKQQIGFHRYSTENLFDLATTVSTVLVSTLITVMMVKLNQIKMTEFNCYPNYFGPVTNNENINIDGSKILTSTAVWPLRNINIDDRK